MTTYSYDLMDKKTTKGKWRKISKKSVKRARKPPTPPISRRQSMQLQEHDAEVQNSDDSTDPTTKEHTKNFTKPDDISLLDLMVFDNCTQFKF